MAETQSPHAHSTRPLRHSAKAAPLVVDIMALFGLHRLTSPSCDRGESSHAPREQQLPRDMPPSYVAVADSDQNSDTAASSRQALDEKNTPVNLQIIFLPDTNCTSSLDLDWEAYLYVQSRDIAGHERRLPLLRGQRAT